jgi:peptide/nickel transport system substrate-binding protein
MRKSVLVIMLLAVVVAACTPAEGDQTTTTAPDPASSTSLAATTTRAPDGFGGSIRVGLEILPTALNPFSNAATFDTRIIGNAVWAKVFDLDPATGDRVPDNVTALPSKTAGGIVDNGDGTITVQYQVAGRATWSDGTPMTGADLAFTAEALRDLAAAGNPLVDPVMASVVETDSVEQVAWVTYSENSLTVEDALWIILPSHIVGGQNLASADGLDWPAGGPFMIDGEITSLVRNPNYWKTDETGRQLPYADALTFVPMSDDALAAFTDRTVDVVSVNPTPENLSAIEGLRADGAEASVAASPIIEHITFNLDDARLEANPSSFNTDIDYRTAIAHAVDRQGLLDESGVAWAPATGLIVPNGDAWGRYGYDSSEARSLVSSLDVTSEPVARLSTTVNAPQRPSIAEALAASFAPIGVGYQVDLQDSIVFFQSSLPEGTYDLGMWAWANDGSYSSMLALAELFDPATGNGSFSGWGASGSASAARYSDLLATASAAIDPIEFESALAEAEEILASELAILPLFRRVAVAAVWVDTVSGVRGAGSSNDLTWNIEEWQVAGA